MKKLFGNITVFALWLACTILLAHSFIPHDHHSDTSVIDDACSSHHSSESEKSEKSAGFPIHCHALNDLACEKNTSLVVNPNLPVDDLWAVTDENAFTVGLFYTNQRFFDFQELQTCSIILELSHLRAPPVLA